MSKKIEIFNKKNTEFYLSFVILTCIFLRQVSFIDQNFNYISIIDIFIKFIYYFNFLCIIISWIILLVKNKIKIDSIIISLFFIISILVTFLVYPQNIKYLNNIIVYLVYGITCYSIIRSNLLNINLIKKNAIKISRGVCCLLIFNIFWVTSKGEAILYMNYSDAMLLVTLILIYSGLIEKNKNDFLISIFSMITIVIYGARSAMFMIIIYFILSYLLYTKGAYKFVILAMSSIGGIFVGIYNEKIINFLINFCLNNGINSRTIYLLSNNNLFSSNSRIEIYRYLLNVLGRQPILGIGLAGDRYYLPLRFTGQDATYAHNIFLEIILNFGMVIGAIIIIYLIYLILKYFIFNNIIQYDIKMFICIFFVVSFVQLLISRSYLTEVGFFILLAMLNNLRKNKNVCF